MDIDIESDMGHFGWEELIGGFVMPYIVRENKKYCSLDIFTKHGARYFHWNMNDDDLRTIDDLQTYPLTQIESYLMNEINHLHCDSLYDHNFKNGDTLLELNDIKQMIRYFYDCHQKLSYGDEYELHSGGILSIRIRIDEIRKDFLVPYVQHNCIRYVPINKCEFYNGTPKQSIKLTGINLQYMKFMHKVLEMEIGNIGQCTSFEDIATEIGHKRMKVREYWPKKDLRSRFYTSMEPTIGTFDVSDESSTESQHEFEFGWEIPIISQQMPVTVVPAKQPTQQHQIITIEPPSDGTNQFTVEPHNQSTEIDENGNEPSTSANMQIRKRTKAIAGNTKDSKEKNKKQAVSELKFYNLWIFSYCRYRRTVG